ncbi:MAG: GNAT family N-acetyltransferase [Candidatus Daviesbacteria bacterium]|nr:GNAT family N-acetyltransferase [Candidatus Daviesbacteria bacterium]
MKLVLPAVKYQKSYLEALEEAESEAGPVVLAKPELNQSFEEFVKRKIEEAKGLHLPEGFVPATELWLVDKDEFIGRASIRHQLTENLLKIGGHIGYYIRPSKRKMGYGRMILKLALKKTKKLGFPRALVTCDATNTGSCKIIEANGGILENMVENGKDNPLKKRYWIEIS